MQNTLEFETLSLIVNYPYMLDNTILQDKYFLDNKSKIMFNILKKEHKNNKEFIVGNLIKNKDFNCDYYAELLTSNLYYSNRDQKIKELEKALILQYKENEYKKLTLSFNGNCDELYENLTKLNEIDVNEKEYIKAIDIYKSLSERKEQIKIGYPYIDHALNLSETDLLILAGGTGTGKTAFALNLLNNLSDKYQCVYFNMEMSKSVLYKRLVSLKTGITLQELNDFNELSRENKIKTKEAMEDLERKNIILINKSLNTSQIKNIISQVKTKKHIIVFLDHIGLIKSKGNSLYEKMTNVAKELREISLDNNCTVIGLCQLSREAQKQDTLPKLQDLRDSGEIEQSARKVLMIHNKSEDKLKRVQDMEIIIAKNDDGNKIVKDFEFDRYTQKFTEPFK